MTLVNLSFIENIFGSELADFSPPERPRLVPELCLIPYPGGGLLIVGAADAQVFRGKAATEVLPKVLSLLDGTRTIEEISSQLSTLSEDAVRQIVMMLYTRGLLDDGRREITKVSSSVEKYIGRYLDVTRLHSNRYSALANLSDAKVAVAAPWDASFVVDQFRAAGVTQAFAWNGAESREDVDFAIIVGTSTWDLLPYVARTRSLNARALVVEIGDSSARLGPLLLGASSACEVCYRRTCPPLQGTPPEHLYRFWTSLAASHAINVIAGLTIPPFYQRAVEYRFDATQESRFEYVVRLPGCAVCGFDSEFDCESPNIVPWLYHNVAGLPPAELRYPRAFQTHFSAKNVELAKRKKEKYYGAPRVALPPVDPARLDAGEASSLARIACMLWLACGNRESPRPSRIAPSGGNLKSPDLMLIAHEAGDLADGVYHYDGEDHALVYRSDLIAEDVRSALGTRELPVWTIVATGNLKTVYDKYRDFSYRVIGLDAGVASAYLSRGAELARMRVREFSSLDEVALTETLSLPPRGAKTITVVMGAAPNDANSREKTWLRPSEGILELLMSSMREGDGSFASRGEAGGDVLDAMLRRTSVRSYGLSPIPRETLTGVLKRAFAASSTQSFCEPVGKASLIVASRIDANDFNCGVYRFAASTGVLTCVKPGFSDAEATECVTQEGLSRAPYVVFVATDLRKRLLERGPRGYREGLLYAGSVAANIALEATRAGLGACISAGLSTEGYRRLVGSDGFVDCPLVLVCLGFEDAAN